MYVNDISSLGLVVFMNIMFSANTWAACPAAPFLPTRRPPNTLVI